MADSIEAVVDTMAHIQDGVASALDHAGLLLEDDLGERRPDRLKLRRAIYRHVIKAKANTRSDRRANALTKGKLTMLVIPAADDEATDEVGRRVYEELQRIVWTELNPNQATGLQALVGEVSDDEGLGYVLVRTKVSLQGNPVDAAYVTTDYGLIAEDFTSPLGQAVTRAAKRYASNATMLIKRGQNARRIRKGLDAAMRNATALAASTVDLALPRGDDE